MDVNSRFRFIFFYYYYYLYEIENLRRMLDGRYIRRKEKLKRMFLDRKVDLNYENVLVFLKYYFLVFFYYIERSLYIYEYN